MSRKKLQDKANIKVIQSAKKEGIETIWDRYEAQQPQCSFGMLGLCCRQCNMGPCRISGSKTGVCGATADTVAARDMARATAAGSASHSDHARDLASTLIALGKGHTQGLSLIHI